MIKIREECSGVVMLQIGYYCNNYLIINVVFYD